MSDFLTIVRVSVLPSLERMIDSEQKHLNFLNNVAGVDVTNLKLSSQETLDHLMQRLDQYKVYLKENEYERRAGKTVS